MDPFLLLGSVGLPIILGVGGLIAWRATRNQQVREERPTTWRDESLDDWRRERDAQAEADREQRVANPGEHATTREGSETSERPHTRMGG